MGANATGWCVHLGDGSMKTSNKGIELIKHFEGFKRAPYLCPAGVWTIGYGTTQGITAKTKPITVQDATKLLQRDLERFEKACASPR
jgi:lysozyme